MTSFISLLHVRNQVEGGDSEDEFFTRRDTAEEDSALFQDYVAKNMDEEKKERVKGYLDANPEDEKERFLLDYVKNMRWREEGDDYVPRYCFSWLFTLVTQRLSGLKRSQKRISTKILRILINKIDSSTCSTHDLSKTT